jgi:multidrug efflux pump subunit AcrB
MIDLAIAGARNGRCSAKEPMYEACGRFVFAPIVMTTMAAMFGGLSIALETGNGADTVFGTRRRRIPSILWSCGI